MIKHTILIIDDEINILILLEDFFKSYDFNVLTAKNGKEALEIFEHNENEISYIILDVMMPVIDGWTVCREIRKKSAVPILMLTARSEDYDEIHGFSIGATDYVKKPVRPAVLVARIEAYLKNQNNKEDEILQFGKLSINKNSLTVTIDEDEIYLSPKEYELLLLLAENKGKVITRDELLNKIWGYDYFGSLRTVDTHINRLRIKIAPCDDKIVTSRGFGYRFEG